MDIVPPLRGKLVHHYVQLVGGFLWHELEPSGIHKTLCRIRFEEYKVKMTNDGFPGKACPGCEKEKRLRIREAAGERVRRNAH